MFIGLRLEIRDILGTTILASNRCGIRDKCQKQTTVSYWLILQWNMKFQLKTMTQNTYWHTVHPNKISQHYPKICSQHISWDHVIKHGQFIYPSMGWRDFPDIDIATSAPAVNIILINSY